MPERAPQVIVIAGPNGAGKTSAARDLLRDTVGIDAFVNADVVAQGLSGFRPESAAAEAGRVVWKRLHALAEARADFALESTLSGRSLATFLRKLAGAGYERHILYLWLPSVDLSIERVRIRVQAGGHDVPEEAIRRRFPRSLNTSSGSMCRSPPVGGCTTGREDRTGGSLRSAVDPVPSRYWSPRRGY
jgi:predicted ABC-type ATPase